MQMGFLDAFEDPRSDELWIIGASWKEDDRNNNVSGRKKAAKEEHLRERTKRDKSRKEHKRKNRIK